MFRTMTWIHRTSAIHETNATFKSHIYNPFVQHMHRFNNQDHEAFNLEAVGSKQVAPRWSSHFQTVFIVLVMFATA